MSAQHTHRIHAYTCAAAVTEAAAATEFAWAHRLFVGLFCESATRGGQTTVRPNQLLVPSLGLGLVGPGLSLMSLGLVGLGLSLVGHGLCLVGLWPH